MNIGKQPSIAERLDYLKVCDAAVEAYDRLYSMAKHNADVCAMRNLSSEKQSFAQQFSEYYKLKEYYSKLKVAITMDLCKDPRFMEYRASMQTPMQLENLGENDLALQTIAQQPTQTVGTENIDGPSFGGR